MWNDEWTDEEYRQNAYEFARVRGQWSTAFPTLAPRIRTAFARQSISVTEAFTMGDEELLGLPNFGAWALAEFRALVLAPPPVLRDALATIPAHHTSDAVYVAMA